MHEALQDLERFVLKRRKVYSSGTERLWKRNGGRAKMKNFHKYVII